MRLSTLLKDIISLPAEADRKVSRLVLDSRHIHAGDVFLAVKGTQTDGRHYISAAIAQGASVVLFDAETKDTSIIIENNVPFIPVYHLQQQLGRLGARFYSEPAEQLSLFGVTGTNGKTSCTHFIGQILHAMQIPCAVIGTIGSGMVGSLGEAGLTTPDAISLQAMLRTFVTKGAKAVAIEVSSHSIDQGRINNLPFEIGLFTNLTQDHLDYHGTMDAYAAVKHRFLAEWPIKHLVINADDPLGEEWLSEFAPEKSLFAYSVSPPTSLIVEGVEGLVYAEQVELTTQGIRAHVFSPWGEGPLFVPLIGQFNLSNVLAVLTALCAYGIPFADVMRYLPQLKSVPGRVQQLGGEGVPVVIVDYAHTPDALEKVLQALRPLIQGKLFCVFGCGGDRDHDKRPLMGKIAEKWADHVIITNDNPRHEKPEIIADQIVQGLVYPERATIMLDRSKAIENSIQLAGVTDCILIAGKGAERYQQVGELKLPFDDAEQAGRYLDELRRRD